MIIKKILKTVLIIMICLLLLIGGYVVYVFSSYKRIEDNQQLAVNKAAELTNAPIDKELKILSYNIGFGAYNSDFTFFMDGGSESRCRSKEIGIKNVTGAFDTALLSNSDIYLFQEVDIRGTRSYNVNQFDILKDGFGEKFNSSFAQNYDSPYLFWPIYSPHGANRSGLAVFSRFDINSAIRRQLPVESGMMKIVDLDRAYSVNRISCENGKELIIYNVHLSAYTSDGTVANEQLKILLKDMQKEYSTGNYCLAGGDFNKDLPADSGNSTNTWTQPIPAELIPDDFTLIPPVAAPVKSCRDAGEVYNQDTSFTVTVDGFIVSQNMQITGSAVIDTGFCFSDHNPVYMTFLLK